MHHTTPLASPLSLARLYEQFDAVATGRRLAAGPDFHATIMARLATNRDIAESAGWTSCAIERDGGSGRVRMVGLAPQATQRTIVPDWTVGTDRPGVSPIDGGV